MKRPLPPVAKKVPHPLEMHGEVRLDNYYWLRDREDPDVMGYLHAENAYYKAMTRHTKAFQDRLFREMKARIREDDESVPYRLNGYWYISRYETGHEYPVYTRKEGSLEAPEEVLFDCNALAEGYEYFDLRGIAVSPDNCLAAFGVDTVSRRQYNIRIKDLRTGELLPEVLENTTGSSVWAADNRTLFYTRKDPLTLRSDRIYRHTLGTHASEDILIYAEADESFSTFVYKS
ncbi:MAG TPA: hypothetical protein VLL47_07310, partial [Robiginitalea sp.]|nr:hypothetical protein [Robiginitalea sp.]